MKSANDLIDELYKALYPNFSQASIELLKYKNEQWILALKQKLREEKKLTFEQLYKPYFQEPK